VTDDDSETHRYDKFIGPVAIRNEVGFYVRSEGEILPVGMCPFCCQGKGGAGGAMRRLGVLGIADTTESSELTRRTIHQSDTGIASHVMAHLAYRHMS